MSSNLPPQLRSRTLCLRLQDLAAYATPRAGCMALAPSFGKSVGRSASDAIVPIYGVIGNGIEAAMLGTPTAMLAQVCNHLAGDASVERVILDIDSPGGEIVGVSAAIDALRRLAATKEVHAVVTGTMTSLAYWIGAQASKIWVSETSPVGGLAPIMVPIDESDAYRHAGLRAEPITTQEHKSDMWPGVPISAQAKARLMEEIRRYEAVMHADIAAGRRVALSKVQAWASVPIFIGRDAVAAGLADAVGSIEMVRGTGGAASSRSRAASDARGGNYLAMGQARAAERKITLGQALSEIDRENPGLRDAYIAAQASAPRGVDPFEQRRESVSLRDEGAPHGVDMAGAVLRVVSECWHTPWLKDEIAVACARAFGTRGAFGLAYPSGAATDTGSVRAAVPVGVPNRDALLASCARHGLSAEAAAFVSACLLAQSAGGGLWYFCLACNGVQIGSSPRPPASGAPSIGDRMSSVAGSYPVIQAGFRRAMSEPTFVPSPR